MSIARKVRSVEQLFSRLDQEIKTFQTTSGLHCLSGCGRCCTKPDIDATPLEFLPFAYDLFLKNQAESVLERLKNETSSICVIYAPLSIEDNSKGSCGTYAYRGLICRLFGYGASRDKFGQLRLATCKLIKEAQAEEYERTTEQLKAGMEVPIFSEYYSRLARIDLRLGTSIMPINQAIIEALEAVLHHYAYRPFPKKFRRVD